MKFEIYHATVPSTLQRLQRSTGIRDLFANLNILYSAEKPFNPDTLLGKSRIFDSGGYSWKIGKKVNFNVVLDNHIQLAERDNDIVVPHDRSYHRPHEINQDFLSENLELVDVWGNFGFDNMMYAIHARNMTDIKKQLDHVTSQSYYDIDYVGIASSEINVNDRNWHNRQVAYSLIDMAKSINEVKLEYGISDIHFFAIGGSYTIPIALMLGSNTIDSSTPEVRASRGLVYLPIQTVIDNDLSKINYYVGSPWGKKRQSELLNKRSQDVEVLEQIYDELHIDLRDVISDNDRGQTDANYINRVYFNCLSTLEDIEFWSELVQQNDDVQMKKIINELPTRSVGAYRTLLIDCIDYIDHIETYGSRYEWYYQQRTNQSLLSRWF